MEELPLAIQQKLRRMPGAETGVQTVELILEDGRIVPDVTVVDCAYLGAEETTFEPEMVADVRAATAPPSTWHTVVFIVLLLVGIFVMYYFLWRFEPE